MNSEGRHGTTSTPVSTALPHLDGVEHRFVDLPGLRMHVAEAGTGEPMLLLHGFPQHWWEWRRVIPVLAPHYRVIVPDLRGAGWTAAPSTGYDAAQLSADVIALLDALGLHRVRVIGHDWGALLGFRICLEHPGRVQQFVSLSVPHPYTRLSPGVVAGMRHAWFQAVLLTPGLGSRSIGQGRQWLARYLLRAFSAEPGTLTEEDLEPFLAPLRDPGRARTARALYRGFILPEGSRIVSGGYRATHLTTPTRVLVGEHDPIVSARVLGGHEAYADDLEIETVPGAAHFLPEERPDAVASAALTLFAQR